MFELRAVVTHFGRHENGHYVAYRRHASPSPSQSENVEKEQTGEKWWRLSDDDVTAVDENYVLRQGGVFMLFYERVDVVPATPTSSADKEVLAAPPVQATLPSLEEVAQIPLPAISDDDLDMKAAEDDYVLANPPVSWSPPPKDDKAAQLPTPPESVADDSTAEVSPQPAPSPDPVKAIRMRTSSVIGKGSHKGSSERLRMGSRMVSAS